MLKEEWTVLVPDWQYVQGNVCMITMKCNKTAAFAPIQDNCGSYILQHSLRSKTEFCELVHSQVAYWRIHTHAHWVLGLAMKLDSIFVDASNLRVRD